MSNINLRLYGEQLYPNISKYLSKYINPEIQKEDFITMYKNGLVEFKQVSLKEKINLNPQIIMENATIKEFKLSIPNEQENFAIYLNDMKCSLTFSDIKEEQIESLLIENKKKLIEEFMQYAVSKIEKKDGPSFLDNLIGSVINKILNGLTIEIHNLELEIKIDNENNRSFIFIVDNINYSDEKGIKINNTCLIYKEDQIKINVIDKFDFNIEITHSNENEEPNKLKLIISDFKFEINKNIYFEFLKFFKIFDNAQYKNIYLQYKKLILFHKPIRKENKINYKELWHYAIKTIIKLQKYIKYNKPEIFDLIESSQIKIVKKYLENQNNENEKILLSDKKNTLKATKEKVEKKVIDNKKGNILANAFSFFFSAKKEEDKKDELTEEEKEISEEIYKDSNIINYVNGNINSNMNNKLSSIIDKIKNFLSNVSIDICISKLELILHNVNIGNKQNLFISGMKMNLNYINKEFDFQYSINDIGYEKDKSFFDKNELLNKDAISFSRDKNNNVKLCFGFKNIELNEGLFICLLTFYKSIQTKKKQKLFKEKKYNNIIIEKKEEKTEENEIMKNISNFSFLNNFNISNIPSFSIVSKDNKIEINIKNYSITENSINFTLNIKDSFGEILKDFSFNPKIENNKFIFHLDKPMDIILSNQSTKSFFVNYLRYKKELTIDNKNKIDNKKDDNDELFSFNYTSITNIDLGNIDMNNYSIDLLINKININIYEEAKNYQSSLVIDNFKFLYEKKKLDISLNKIIITTNLMSTMILYFLDFESPLYAQYMKIVELKKESGDINDIPKTLEKKEEENNLVINSEYNYGKLIKEILDTFKFDVHFFSFVFQANDLMMSLNFNNINCFKNKENNSIYTSFDNWYFDIQSPKFTYKTKKIIENNVKTEVNYELNTDIIKGKIEKIYLNTNLVEVVEIWDNISFLMNQINWDIILCKMELVVDTFALVFDQFKYSISQILFSNFKENNINNNTFYFTLLKFIMTNEKQDEIIYEEKLNIDYVFTTSIDNDVIIKCNNPKIKISQHDISFLLLCIKLPEKTEKNDLKRFDSVPLNSQIDFNKKKADFFGFQALNIPKQEEKKKVENKDNNNILTAKYSMLDKKLLKKKKFALTININIPNLNLCFCLNDYTKEAECSVVSSIINLKYTIFDKTFNDQIKNELDYSLLFGVLNFKYFSDKNNEITLLTKRKHNILEENIINTTKGDDSKINQLEINNKNNQISININKNEVNVRFDSLLLIYYYFKGAIPIDEMIDNFEKADFNSNNNKKNFQLSINCNDSRFQICTSYDDRENLYLDIDQFIFMYNLEGKFPYGRFIMILNKIIAIATSNNSVRELFLSNDNCLNVKMDFKEKLLSQNIDLETITINLSYEDLYYFLRVYSINVELFKNAMNKSKEYLKNLEICVKKESKNIINNKQNNAKKLPDNKTFKDIVISSYLNFEKLDITLIDNSEGSYQPFMNLAINKIYLVLNKDNTIESTFSVILSSYNYIACIWEPTIEKTLVKLNNKYEKNEGLKNNKLNIDISTININLSDMAISYTLLTFNKWLAKLEENKKLSKTIGKISDNKNEINNNKEIDIKKITNNQVINYTGIELKIIYNKKEINIPPLGKIELDYINEINPTKKSKCIELIYDKIKIDIPIEKLETNTHKINNDISIVSQNSLSEKRSIITSLFSPIIIVNKSFFPLVIQIYHNKKGNQFYELEQNSIFGIPLNFVHNDTSFNFKLINNKELNDKNDDDYSKSYLVEKLLKVQKGTNKKESLFFKDKTLKMKIDYINVRTVTIFSEYSIANGLPCDIIMNIQNKQIIIRKCSQYSFDFDYSSKLPVTFSMNTENGIFTCSPIDIISLFSMENQDNTIIFTNKEGKRYFNLLYYLQKKGGENIFIIYAEFIIYNDSLTKININTTEHKRKILCFSVSKKVHLISSKIDFKIENISLRSDNYFSGKFLITYLIESSPYLKVELKNNYHNKLNFNIKKHFSYIQMINNQKLKLNIRSMIFNIFDSCRIINLLPNKKFVVCDYHHSNNFKIVIDPLKKEGFQFFCQGPDIVLGITVMDVNDKNYTNLIKFKFEIGIFTLTVGDYTFNLEISKNSTTGCLEVFVVESTIDNSQIILENLSDEGICIYQNNFEDKMQILLPNQTQILKVYDYYKRQFVIETEGSADIETFMMDNNEKKIRNLNKNIMLLIVSNGLKMKAKFYNINTFVKLESLLINYKTFINIKQIYISIIGDNEYPDSKLIEYKRNELLLFVISNFCLDISREKIEGPINKDFIRLSINLKDMSIYNQKSIYGKFSCFFKNIKTPFFTLCNEINYYKELRIAKVDYQAFELSEMDVGIDPSFITEIFNFWDNILYRMNITNFNIHKLFLLEFDENDPKSIINEYNRALILINATRLQYPKFNIKFELSSVGVDEFLRDTMGCSEFYVWVIKGLIGNRHKLTLEEEILTFTGGFIQYLKWFYDHNYDRLESHVTSMGFKGIFGHFKNILTYDDKNITTVQDKRVRVPRVFYGKFKYMKKYNEKEELLISNIYIVNKVLRDKFFPTSIIIGKNELFLFTTSTLFNSYKSNYKIKWYINYINIKNTELVGNKVKINYNQMIDNRQFFVIICENMEIAESVSKFINEEINNISTTFNASK